MSKGLLSIIVLSWNRLGYTRQTIENIVKKTTVPHILVLVDNNSDLRTGVKDYLSSINESNTNAEKVIHVFNDCNMGVSGGRNSGIYAVERSGLKQQYIFNVDDDVILPDDYDKQFITILDGIPRVELAAVSVEPFKFPIVEMNGVKVRIKKQGNLNGCALCMSRKLFKVAGYYGFGKGTMYGHEDSVLRTKLDILGLLGVYIPKKGIHLDKDADKAYRAAKNNAHKKRSIQLCELSGAKMQMLKTKNVYTPYTKPELYHPVDEDIFTNDMIMNERKQNK